MPLLLTSRTAFQKDSGNNVYMRSNHARAAPIYLATQQNRFNAVQIKRKIMSTTKRMRMTKMMRMTQRMRIHNTSEILPGLQPVACLRWFFPLLSPISLSLRSLCLLLHPWLVVSMEAWNGRTASIMMPGMASAVTKRSATRSQISR